MCRQTWKFPAMGMVDSSAALHEIARQGTKRQGLESNIEWTECNWMEIAVKCGEEKFDVILVLGNSLCLILE
jgi:hypothetical protein